jgi:hypothetical protein
MKSRFFYCLVIVALLLIIAGTLIYYETPNAGVEQFSEDIYGSNASYRFPGSACPVRERVFSLHRV